MTVAQAIKALSDLRDEYEPNFTTEQCEAIGIAMVIMAALEPSQVVMIDELLALTYKRQN